MILTLIETFNHGCDIDLEHSNPIFSLDTSLLMMIYHQAEFGCKILTGLEIIKGIVETGVFWLHKPTLWPDMLCSRSMSQPWLNISINVRIIFMNRWTFCNQPRYCGATLWAGMAWEKTKKKGGDSVSSFFLTAFRLIVVHRNTSAGYKRLHTNTQPTRNK